MFLTTRGRYATRALLELARHHGSPPMPVAVIATTENVSEKYLQQLFGTLRRAGLVRVVMGPHGGFTLARPPNEISIGDILRAVEGDLTLCECVEKERFCPRVETCQARKVWTAASQELVTFLDKQTLDVVLQEEHGARGVATKKKRRKKG